MTLLFVILVILASVILSLIVLIQNPKGGGLAGNIAGFSNQFMGVKQTNDVLEKGTWIFGGIIGALCLVSAIFMSTKGSSGSRFKDATVPVSAPAAPAPGQDGNTLNLGTGTIDSTQK